jgi:hypothetical protein|uniref:Uncharacterized protein n=1 Tax=Siphoviridae sp. ctQU013 TaxID=2826329 RepID=A0A8S5NMU1_9CAUD|nr:MAG TPA: hypothetical protein [Siphoviridae sp. ctQU013]
MTKVLTDSKYYTAIANAIRAKNGSTAIYKPSGMAAAISAIQVDGGSAAMYPKVRIKQTENQVIRATPKIRSNINSSIASNDIARDGYVDFDWHLSHGTPIQFEVTVSATEDNYIPGNLVVNGENIGSTKATLDIDKDLIIEAEDAKPISNFMPESYAVLYQKGAGAIVRVVSPSLSGGEETGTAVNENKTLICNVTDNAFDVISEMKVFMIYADGAQEAPVTLQKGSPVSAGAPYGEPQAIFAASKMGANAVIASLKLLDD